MNDDDLERYVGALVLALMPAMLVTGLAVLVTRGLLWLHERRTFRR